MNNKAIFNTAHSRTRAIVAENPNLKYRVVFAFQLKKAISEQHKKVTTLQLHANGLSTVEPVNKKADAKQSKNVSKKIVNKKVALVGDYKKHTVKNDNFKLPFFMLSSLFIIFALTLQAINYL